MSKYDPLRSHLEKVGARAVVPMTFAEIERLLGFPLPRSSRVRRAFWSNDPSVSVMTHAWLTAGFEAAEVDLASEKLVFRRASRPPTPVAQESANIEEIPRAGIAAGDREPVRIRHPLFGALKGRITVEPGYDLTKSLFEDDWLEKRLEEKYRDL